MNIKRLRNKFGRLSFSQSAEDLLVKYILDVRKLPSPSYIDVGAHHPWRGNNTAIFYLGGSRGINIEPDPNLIDAFHKERKKDCNLNIGVGNTTGEMDFYIMSARTLNTFCEEEARNYQDKHGYKIVDVIKVPLLTLPEVLDRYNKGDNPDVYNIDAEGLDFDIVQSIPFNKKPPKVICVETISFSEKGDGEQNQKLIDFIVANGYINYANTNVNTIFVHSDFWLVK